MVAHWERGNCSARLTRRRLKRRNTHAGSTVISRNPENARPNPDFKTLFRIVNGIKPASIVSALPSARVSLMREEA